LEYFPRLGQVAILPHLIDDLQVFVDLAWSGQTDHIGSPLYLLIQVLHLVIHIHLLGSQAVEVNTFVIEAIEIAVHIREALLALLGLR